MIYRFLFDIYCSKLIYIKTAIPIIVLVWSVFGAICYKYMHIISKLLSVAYIALILYVTVFTRVQAETRIYLMPFSSFERAKINPEIYRSMLMNVFFFLPIGLFLPFAFRLSNAKRILITVLIGFLLSLTVESVQFIFHLGLAETDDVLCNTLGTIMGTCSFLLTLLWRKITSCIINSKNKT